METKSQTLMTYHQFWYYRKMLKIY